MSGGKFPRQYAVVAETRRCWSDVEKGAIVTEAEQPGVNISALARRHGIKPSLLFRWRRLARETKSPTSAPTFIPVTLALPAAEVEVPADFEPDTVGRHSPASAGSARRHADSRIEIEFGNGRLVRVGADVDVAVLRRILDALERR
jgi:transposase